MAIDKRAEQLANLVLDYSISLEKGDRLIIQYDPQFNSYANLFGSIAREKGAEVLYDSIIFNPRILREFIKNPVEREWKEELERRKSLASWCNTRVLINCDSNPDYAEGLKNSQELVAKLNKEIIGPYKEVLYRPSANGGDEVRWNIVGFPCRESAKLANMSLKDYTELVYSATLIPDWKKVSKDMSRIKSVFDNAQDIHLFVPNLTDLHFSLNGRGGDICAGKHNMPDGEVFYGPVEDSINGQIYFQCPTIRDGLGVISGIKLNFKNGKVTDCSAKKNQGALESTLNADAGAKGVGEFGIGCNPGIQNVVLDTLYDEKIAGTIHLALGNSFKSHPFSNGGGLNKSAIHWDIICDLRRNEKDLAEYPGGEIYVDGKLVQRNGEWLI